MSIKFRPIAVRCERCGRDIDLSWPQHEAKMAEVGLVRLYFCKDCMHRRDWYRWAESRLHDLMTEEEWQ